MIWQDIKLISCFVLWAEEYGLWRGSLLHPSGVGFRPPAKFGTPARRAARWGRLWGCAPFITMSNPVLRALGRHRRLRRRAVRHENQSFTARQSRDLLLISGRVDAANTPSGLRSFPPCIPPRSPPKESFQLPSGGEGDASFAAGASFPRSARSGDLPPRRVMPNLAFALNRTLLQPSTSGFFADSRDCFVSSFFNDTGLLESKAADATRLFPSYVALIAFLPFPNVPPSGVVRGATFLKLAGAQRGRRSKCGFAAARIYLSTMYKRK